jgi:hypothetical protein
VKKQVRSVLLFHHNNRSYQILVILRLFLGACFGFTAQKGVLGIVAMRVQLLDFSWGFVRIQNKEDQTPML